MDWIIGGQDRIGQGWRMLMQCLAAGRAISLPALGVANGKMAALMSGAYARIRRQFNLPIGQFEGIEEPLARWRADLSHGCPPAHMVALTRPPAGRSFGIIKHQLTEASRRGINDAMDIHGGKGM
jgi:acyl-CoA dehydrogenase